MTNYEKIKSMSIEQMTDFILGAIDTDICDYCEHRDDNCKYYTAPCMENEEIIAIWLKEEYQE